MSAEQAPTGGAEDPVAEPQDPRSSRRRRLVIVLVTSLALLLAALGGASYYAYRMAQQVAQSLQSIPDPFAALPTRPPPPGPVEGGAPLASGSDEDQNPVNILMVGSDSRVTGTGPGHWEYGAQRTDAIMLLHIPGDREDAYVISFPRDSWVAVPGYGNAKINAAYSYGGFPLLIQTIEQLTGIRIDHVAVADFDGFVELTDAVGGVEVTIPQATSNFGVDFPAGTQVLSGAEALAYARQRYGLPGGDLDRIKRQQNWVRAIGQKIMADGTLENPAGVIRLARTLSKYVAVDPGFDLPQMISVALALRQAGPNHTTFLTVPVAGLGWSPDGLQSIVRLDRAGVAGLSAAVIDDSLDEYIDAREDDLTILGDTVR